jgi:hypothetical protein
MAERKPDVGSIGVFIKTASQFLILVCQTDLTFDRSRDTIDANTKCGPDQIPSNNPTFEISGTAQVWLFDDDNPESATKLSEAGADRLLVNKTVFEWKIGPLSGVQVPGDVVYSGEGFFTNLSTSWGNEDAASFDFTISIKGQYDQEIEPATT